MLTIRLHKVMPAIMLQLNLKEEAIKIIKIVKANRKKTLKQKIKTYFKQPHRGKCLQT
jgi:hypothetical protein